MTTPATPVVDDPPEGGQNTIPPLASYEDLRADYWYPNMPREIRRLWWSLDGPLDKAVSVMYHAYYDPDDPPPEPFYCPKNDDDDGVGTWHALSHLSLFEPKVSSVTIDVDCLSEWAGGWGELHMDCDTLLWDKSSDELEDEEDDDKSSVARSTCYCGEPTPWSMYDELTIHASSTVQEGGGYVTIRDYVAAVHPWLMSMRELFLKALGDYDEDIPLPADTKLMAMTDSFSCGVCVLPAPEWFEWSRHNPFPEHPSPPRKRLPPPSPPFVPVGGIDLSIVESNRNRPPPGLRDAHIWPGI